MPIRLIDGKPDEFTLAARRRTHERIDRYKRLRDATRDPEWHWLIDRRLQEDHKLLASLH